MSEPKLPYFDHLLSELDQRNQSIEKSFGRHVHWGYWDDPARARGDDDDYAQAAENLTLELCRLSGIVEGETVLDVGCGFGGTVASLNERFTSLRLTGLNIDERQLERARQQVQPLRDNTVEFRQGDACALPFADASFDRVLAVECIFHFPSREDFFWEAFRVLKPGGTLTLSDFIPARSFLPVMSVLMSERFEQYNFFGHCDVSHTIERYRDLASRTGFVSVTERNVSRNILPTYDYLQRIGTQIVTSGWWSRLSGLLIGIQKLMVSTGMLNYDLLSFRKP